jgi:SH3 domain protein
MPTFFGGVDMQHRSIGNVLPILILGFLFSTAAWVRPAGAQTQYVTDQLVLFLREAPGNDSKVIRSLRTGMAAEVLEEQEAYVKIRTREGEEGWVGKQYLTSETPKSVTIAQLNEQIENFKNKLAGLEKKKTSLEELLDKDADNHSSQLKQIKEKATEFENQATRTAEQLKQMTDKYETLAAQSKDLVALVAERDKLIETNKALNNTQKDLKAELEQLHAENQKLAHNEILYWFLAGGGVFFIGLVIGKYSRRKKRY